VSTTQRLDVLPDVPTIGEFVPGFETGAFAGLGAPKGTPAEIIETLNREVVAGLADPSVKGRVIGLGGVPLPVSALEFGKLIADETDKWGKVVKASGAKPN
jgi:tripartite-type tricarboxylate transporter receptor subunit TctC